MTSARTRFSIVLAVLLGLSGAGKLWHEVLAHSEAAHHEVATTSHDSHGECPPSEPDHRSGDDCPTCHKLAASATLGLPTSVVSMGAPRAAPVGLTRQRPVHRAVTRVHVRGPPTRI